MKFNRKKIGTCIALAAASLTLLMGCGSGGSDSSDSGSEDTAQTSDSGAEGETEQASGGGDVELHMGYFPNVTHPQALVMKAQGSLESALDGQATVTWTSFNAGPAEVEALFAGEIDIGYIGPVPAINANVKSKGDVKVISGSTEAGAILVKRKDAEISTVADLDGKKVAVPQFGNTQHLCLLDLLADNGLKPLADGGTVDVVAVANADVANMMDQGNIDAACVPEPWGATLLQKGAEMVLDENELYLDGDYNVAVVVVRQEFMDEHPDIVKTFLQQHEDATAFINDSPSEAQGLINDEIYNATQKNLDPAILEEAFTRIKVDTAINKEAMDDFARIGIEQDFISELPGEDMIVEVE